MSLFEDDERIDQLGAEKPVAEIDEGEARERGDDILAADTGPIG